MKTSSHSRVAPMFITSFALLVSPAWAVTNEFFSSSQTTNFVQAGETWDTLSSAGYLFTYTRDKLFTGGVGLTNPIGRTVRVPWPEGLEAQAVTTGPVQSKARFDITRLDGQPFAIRSFTAMLLGNTFGAGANIEIMPMLQGEDARPEPFMYNATGFYGGHFNYSTPELSGYEAYKITLYVDFALKSLTMVDPSLPPPYLEIWPVSESAIELSWPTNATGFRLESATNLPATAWSQVTNSVMISGDLNTVTVDIGNGPRFFRLTK